jgi:hypothetical protein
LKKQVLVAALAAGLLIVSGCGSSASEQDSTMLTEDQMSPEQIEDAANSAQESAEPVAALALVSSHRWSTWDNPCNGVLQATYNPQQGQVIFRNGQLLQDSNKPNIAYEITENSDGSFTFDQVTADPSLPDVIVTVLRENISLESETKIKIERVSISLSNEAMNDFSIMSANPNDNPEYYEKEEKTIYEQRCS